jgi:two-component system OmpR family response regulator
MARCNFLALHGGLEALFVKCLLKIVKPIPARPARVLECVRLNMATKASIMKSARFSKQADVARHPGAVKRILYIEDEPDLQWLVKHILESMGGYEVMVCGSGAEGLRALPGFSPDLVLLDMMLPGMDGASVLRAMRASPAGAALPVIFLTARSRDDDACRDLGTAGFISKPFEPMGLIDQIRAYRQEPALA